MIITISGKAGSGKSTVAKELAKKLGLRHHSIGDFMRQMAKERGISLLELGKIAEKDKSIDRVRAERILKDERKDEKSRDIDSVIEKIREREASERKRYRQYYGIDYYDEDMYNIVIDTTKLSAKEVVERIIKSISKRK